MTATTARSREQRLTAYSVRSEEATSGKLFLTGHASVFNTLYPVGSFFERVKKGAFSRAITERQDVRFLLNHNAEKVIARTAAGTLELAEDYIGLWFRAEVPNTSYALDLVESVKRGNVSQCSFGFKCTADSWSQELSPVDRSKKVEVRTIEDCDLLDCSVVAYPASPTTSVSVEERARFNFPDSNGALPAEIRNTLEWRQATTDTDFDKLTAASLGLTPELTAAVLKQRAVGRRIHLMQARQFEDWLEARGIKLPEQQPAPLSAEEKRFRELWREWATKHI